MAHALTRVRWTFGLQGIDSIKQFLFRAVRRIGALHRPIHW